MELPPDLRELLLDSASGLTSIEAENAFALCIVESGKLCASIVAREKANEVKKNGLLEVVSSVPSLDAIGGLDLLKKWLLERKDAFSLEAQRYERSRVSAISQPQSCSVSSLENANS